MEELITKNVNCPSCNHFMEYWTKSNFIECIKCKNMIDVEPCVEAINTDAIEEESIEKDISGE